MGASMPIEMTKPWRPFDRIEVGRLPGQTGVFELADSDGNVLYIGMAGGKTKFGLRGELEKELKAPGEATRYRVEVNTMYLSRHEELLMAYAAEHGTLPPWNVARGKARMKGRLSPR
jgi:hypothetical protein